MLSPWGGVPRAWVSGGSSPTAGGMARNPVVPGPLLEEGEARNVVFQPGKTHVKLKVQTPVLHVSQDSRVWSSAGLVRKRLFL